MILVSVDMFDVLIDKGCNDNQRKGSLESPYISIPRESIPPFGYYPNRGSNREGMIDSSVMLKVTSPPDKPGSVKLKVKGER